MEDTNTIFRIMVDGKEHDLVISKENLAAIGAGAYVALNGKTYFPKITTYMGATASNYYLDNKPLLELIEVEHDKETN